MIWFECVKNIRYLVKCWKAWCRQSDIPVCHVQMISKLVRLLSYRICLISFPQNEATWNKKCEFRNWNHVTCRLKRSVLEDIRIFLWFVYRVCWNMPHIKLKLEWFFRHWNLAAETMIIKLFSTFVQYNTTTLTTFISSISSKNVILQWLLTRRNGFDLLTSRYLL